MEMIPLIHSIWTIVVMVIFFGVVAWVLMSDRSRFDEAARLPLDDDDSIATIAKEQHHV